MNNQIKLVLCAILLLTITNLPAQFSPTLGCFTDLNGSCIPNAILRSAPFLTINPNARTGGMGDTGTALNNGANSLHFNASLLAFGNESYEFSTNYISGSSGLSDFSTAYLSGFKRFGIKDVFGFSIRHYNYELFHGLPGTPVKESEFLLSYARRVSDKLSAGVSFKYIYSNIGAGQNIGGISLTSAQAIASDISLAYKIPLSSNLKALSFGLVIKNLGSKLNYINEGPSDFLPTQLSFGSAVNLQLGAKHHFNFVIDINKLLIPSPQAPTLADGSANPNFDEDEDGIADYRQEAIIGALFNSFGDAQGGFSEELNEYNYSLGIEYWYNKLVALRIGNYFEHELKGNRNYLTLGAGFEIQNFELDFAYMIPHTPIRNPLDNRFKLSLNYGI